MVLFILIWNKKLCISLLTWNSSNCSSNVDLHTNSILPEWNNWCNCIKIFYFGWGKTTSMLISGAWIASTFFRKFGKNGTTEGRKRQRRFCSYLNCWFLRCMIMNSLIVLFCAFYFDFVSQKANNFVSRQERVKKCVMGVLNLIIFGLLPVFSR